MSQITQGISQTKRQKFLAEAKALKNSERLATNCSHLREIGSPTYPPVYMVRHGMDAVVESMEGKEETTYEPPQGFDAESAWAAALDYADCSEETANPSEEAAN